MELSCRVKSNTGIMQASVSGSQVESPPVNVTERVGNCSRYDDTSFLKENKTTGGYLSQEDFII